LTSPFSSGALRASIAIPLSKRRMISHNSRSPGSEG
jgi:hypothetical protein